MKIVIGRVRAKPETLDELLAIGLEHCRRSRKEPGCLFHSVHQEVEDPLNLFFYEEWENEEALQAHFAVPASLEFVTKLSERTAKPPSMEIYDSD